MNTITLNTHDNHHTRTSPQTTQTLTYDPNRLFDTLMTGLGLGSDKALSRQLQMSIRTLRGLRARRLPLRACILSQIAEYAQTDVQRLRQALGDRRCKVRLI